MKKITELIFIRFIILLFIPALSFASVTGPENRYNLVHDYKDEWQVYDATQKLYLPYVREQNFDYTAHTVIINAEDFPYATLLLKSDDNSNFLFINGALIQKMQQGKWKVFKINELKSKYKSRDLYITLYGGENAANKVVQIGYPSRKNQISEKDVISHSVNIKPRTNLPYKSTFVVIFIVTLVLASFLSNSYPRAFQRFYNVKDMLSFLVREQSFLINKPLNRTNMLFVILLSIITGFLYIIVQSKGINLIDNRFIFQDGQTFGLLLSHFLKLSILFFILFVFKFFLINTIGRLFNLDKVVEIHFFKLIQSTLYFFSLMLIVLLVLFNIYVFSETFIEKYFLLILAIFYSFRTIIIYFTINRTINVQSLYLISYLCIVEVLPIIIGLRFAN